ncbi:MAG: OmpA family protein [Bacteroidales bacterium]
MKRITIFFAIAFLSIPYFALSQDASSKKFLDNWSVNLNGGASLFWGDLKQYKIFPVTNFENEWNVAYGLVLTKKLNSIFELRGQFIKGNLTGTRRPLGVYFDAQFNSYNINATLNFGNLFYGDNPCRKLNIYGIAGIGLFDFRAVKKTLGSNTYITSRGYSANGTVKEKMQTETTIPLGIGFKYKLDSRFEINFENIWTVVNSDDVDMSRGGVTYDIISYSSLGLTYKFNFRNNPAVFADCGDNVSSKAKKGSLGDAGNFDKAVSNAEKDSLNAKLKMLEERINNQDSKIKELENKANTPPAEINMEALKASIYNSILDTLKRYPTTVISAGYLQFSIFFDVNKYDIKADEMKKVASIAERMKSDKSLKLKVVGNADQSGSDIFNKNLSNKRAEQVYNTLINKFGIEKTRLSFEGKGKDDPFSKEHISVNRRVDFIKQ